MIVDLVRNVIPPRADKVAVAGIVVDSPREIVANKLCRLLSRSELRDLVDVRALEQSGLSIETALFDAARKDAGLTPATLLEVLAQLTIGPDAKLPGAVPPAEMNAWIEDLRHRLRRLAWPGGGSWSSGRTLGDAGIHAGAPVAYRQSAGIFNSCAQMTGSGSTPAFPRSRRS